MSSTQKKWDWLRAEKPESTRTYRNRSVPVPLFSPPQRHSKNGTGSEPKNQKANELIEIARCLSHFFHRFQWPAMRILVVEDEPDLLRTVAQALREDGYAVDEAGDGTEGLYKATTWEYDAVVLDLLMPGLTGWEVLQRLRKTHRTPVLILTARDQVQDRVRGLDNGADDYLTKPFHLMELRARLRALIRRSVGAASSEIRIGLLTLDMRSRQVTRDDVVIALTPREYALLELLALHRGRVVSRTEIYDHLFDEHEESLSNLVDVHVSNLRRKLGGDFITTRRGQGYILHD